MTTIAALAPRHPLRLALPAVLPAALPAQALPMSLGESFKHFLAYYCACLVAASAFIA